MVMKDELKFAFGGGFDVVYINTSQLKEVFTA